MGCILGSFASSIACCFGTAACQLCCSCLPGCKGSTASRVGYAALFLFSLVVMCIFMIPGVGSLIMTIPGLCSRMLWWQDPLINPQTCLGVFGYTSVYRIAFALTCFFAFFCLLMIRVETSRDCRAKIHNGFWFFKLLILVGLVVAAYFIPSDPFASIWLWFGMVGAWIFILMQLVLLVDFAHAWNTKWLAEYEESDNRMYLCGLLFFTILFYLFSIGGIVCFYLFYMNGTDGCIANKVVVSVNLCLCFVLSIVSIIPRVQEGLNHSGLLQSSIITLYVTYLTWSGMTNNPDPTCNPALNIVSFNATATQQSTSATVSFSWQTALSLLILFLCLIYSCIRNSAHSTVGRLSGGGGGGSEMTVLAESSSNHADNEKGQHVWDDEEDQVGYNYSFFHFMMMLASLYAMMVLTSWYKPASELPGLNANDASMWMKFASTWVCLLIYFWTLIAPIVLQDRSFD